MEQITGMIDRLERRKIAGWAYNPINVHEPVQVELCVNGVSHATTTANLPRADLERKGVGTGRHAFSFDLANALTEDELASVAVKAVNTEISFKRAAILTAKRPDSAALPAPTAPGEFRSAFGGLWIDRPGAVDRMAEKHRSGEISDQECMQLLRFMRDGYLILPGAVNDDLCRDLSEEIGRIWQSPPDDAVVETFMIDGRQRYVKPELSLRDKGTKLLDIFRHCKLAREAIAAPRIQRFLSIIFEDAPAAFQSLSFWYGSEQSMHKDTAYVKVAGNPLAMAATWLALENIEPGTGELEYYVGSHTAPDFLFEGNRKWMLDDSDNRKKFVESLHADAKKYNHKRSNFLGRRGDVLIWHADLAHGGSAIIPPRRTRKSLVTHFCPASQQPWSRFQSRPQYNEVWFRGVRFQSDYGPVHD